MKDIKVIEGLIALIEDKSWWNENHNPVEFFAEAVARTRAEGDKGVSIKDIARCFKAQFDEDELKELIKELKCKN